MLRRTLYVVITAAVLSLIGALAVVLPQLSVDLSAPIKVGILHSQTGPLASGELPLLEVTRMAFDELNAEGGVLGRQVEVIAPDCASDPKTFARQAEGLILEEQVATLFGCWTSDSRKTVLPIVEKHQHLLYYPVLYEGLEDSSNVIYLGAAPNQRILPGLRWSVLSFGRRVYLVAPDYVYGHAANAIIREQMRVWRGDVAGEAYVRLVGDEAHISSIIEEIRELRPNVILNNLFGESYKIFTQSLRTAGITPQEIPQMSFAMTETQIADLGILEEAAGDYVVANYFQSLPGERNQQFIARYRQRLGRDRATDDFIENNYSSVFLWALAVQRAGSPDVESIRKASVDLAFQGPSGIYYVDPDNRHVWRRVYIGRFREDGQVDIVWTSGRLIQPEPFPELHSREAWEKQLELLHQMWGGNWMNMSETPSPPFSSFRFDEDESSAPKTH